MVMRVRRINKIGSIYCFRMRNVEGRGARGMIHKLGGGRAACIKL